MSRIVRVRTSSSSHGFSSPRLGSRIQAFPRARVSAGDTGGLRVRPGSGSRGWWLGLAALAVFTASPSAARADDGKECPPGSWFCGDASPPATGANKELQPLPASGGATETKPAPAPPPVVVYQPPPSTVIVPPHEAPPPYYYVPRQPPRKQEWGLNLHVGGLVLGKGRDDNAGMALVGLGLRFRPLPALALEVDLDVAGGRDYNGFRRRETALGFNGLLFLNPRDRAQVYFLAGFGWAGATAIDDRSGYDLAEYHYGYFGGTAGIGLEFRLSKLVALNFDVRGFVRGRVDERKRDYPEFVSTDGRTSNTSGGGLLQGGLTFYW